MSVQENTAKVNSIIRKAQKEVKSAEQQFAYEKKCIERKARYSTIDICNMSEVVTIVDAVKRITDELYASHEAIVRMVDMKCKPLLEKGIEVSDIKAVTDFIKKVNEESSGLTSNITGSLNGKSLGDIRTEHYVASLEAKTIEKFWAVQYSMISEATQAEEERYREANQQLASEMEEFKEKVCEEIKKHIRYPKNRGNPMPYIKGKQTGRLDMKY